MAANLATCKTLVVSDEANATGTTTISIADFAPQGCTIRGLKILTQATAGGAGTIQITHGTGGANLLGGNAATTANVARVVGGYQIPLTTTTADLGFDATDSIVITRATATSQSDYIFFFGDRSPISITTS